MRIKIKYFDETVPRIEKIEKGDWIDLRSAGEYHFIKGAYLKIDLGIGMKLPRGYEAHIVPRGSTYKNFGIIQANHMGVVDESYCGDNDRWFLSALAWRDGVINVGDRVCQFRIVKKMPKFKFKEVKNLGKVDRGGFGSTGIR